MQLLKKYLIVAVALAVMVLSGPVSLLAANLGFGSTQTEVKPDNTFDVTVTVDPGTQQISATDMYIIYDPEYLELSSVSAGSYFPSVDNKPSSGNLYIAGFVTTSGDYKEGIGTVATVTFKALKEGTTTLTYECDLTNADDTSKIIQNDVSTSNIINCSENQEHSVVITEDAVDNGTSSNSTSTTGDQLPESGMYEDMIRYATMGGILLVMGISLRVLLRIV
jgi:hypothetical protein